MKKYFRYIPYLPALLAVLLYANTLGHQYVQDDAIVIHQNKLVKQGFAGWDGLLNKDTFYGFFQKEGKDNLVAGGRYRPLTLMQFSIGWSVFGDNPMLFHLINILWYAFLGWLVYQTLYALLNLKYNEDKSMYIALIASLVFVAHPVHTEVVANIKGRDEIMALILSLTAFYYFIKYYKSGSKLALVLSSLALFIGLFAKENTITFLGVIPLGIYLFAEKIDWPKLALGFGSLFISTALFLWKRFEVLGFSLGKETIEMMNNPFVKVQEGKYVFFETSEKAATIIYSLGQYIRLLIFPNTLTHDYYPRTLGVMQMGDPLVILALIFHIMLVGMALYFWRKKPIISFGILFYIMTLSIVSNIFFPVGTHLSERFIFMPSLGFALILGLLIYQFGVLNKQKIVLGFAGLILLLFSYKTITRNVDWYDNYTLFTKDILVSKNSAKLQNSVGGELINKAKNTKDEDEKKTLLVTAQNHLTQAIKIHPNYKNAYLLLGNSYIFGKEFDKGINAYQSALKIDPKYPEAKNNLFIAYRSYGKELGEKGDVVKALGFLEAAHQFNASDVETIRLLGVAYGSQGDHAKAISYFTKATKLSPNDANAWMNLATAYQYVGDTENMQMAYDKSVALKR